MAQTSKEIRMAWDKAHYRRYGMQIRKDTEESVLIDYIEEQKKLGRGSNQIIKDALRLAMEQGK